MKHKEIRWNPYTQEWFCVVCGRTSDHVSEADARNELDMYECQLPARDGQAMKHDLTEGCPLTAGNLFAFS
jgi:hypothetical protein